MRKLFFILCMVLFCISVDNTFAQTSNDIVKYDYDFEFKDGIYINFYDFRNNAPISYRQVIFPKYDDDFFDNLQNAEIISFYDANGTLNEIPTKAVWGYARNGKPFIHYCDRYNLIPLVGTISHFVSIIIVQRLVSSPGVMYYDPMYAPVDRTYACEEIVHFLLDMRTGEICDFNPKNLCILMENDSELHDEFAKLKKRKQGKMAMSYITKYNQRHDIYFNK